MNVEPLSDPATRAKAILLASQSPVRIPILVKQSYGIVALCVVLGFIPAFALVYKLTEDLFPLFNRSLNTHLSASPGFLAFCTFALVFLPPWLLLYYVGGRYTCRLVAYYAQQGNEDDAEVVALGFQHTVWYLHFRNSEALQSLAKSRDLATKSDRYRRFMNRLGQ